VNGPGIDHLRPLCGDYDPHPAHLFHRGASSCPGWDARDAAAVSLIRDLAALAYQWHLLSDPPQVVLECHPAVPAALMKVIIPPYIPPYTMTSDPVEVLLPVRVEVRSGMGYGTWRLVVLQGALPGAAAADLRESGSEG
jgi:hypothetical protein